MDKQTNNQGMDRRDFMKKSAAAAIAGSALAGAAPALADVSSDDALDHRNERPDKMTYRKLGRTNFMSSRLVFGCGAALQGGKALRLLEEAFENGINFYDIGSDAYYKGSEKNFAPFVKQHRDDIFIVEVNAVHDNIL